MIPIRANGQLAAAAYHFGEGDTYRPFAIIVLATTSSHLCRISLFADPTLFACFDLPATMPAERSPAEVRRPVIPTEVPRC